MSKSTLSNQQCNYLLTQFESFAKQFTNNNNNSSPSSSSPSSSSSLSSSSYSTLLKSSSNHLVPCKIKSVTLNKYSAFNHDRAEKSSHIEAIKRGSGVNGKEQIIAKNRSETKLSNQRFKQKMLNINNIDLASELLSQPPSSSSTTNDAATQNSFINDYMTFLKENQKANNNNENEINTNETSQLESELKEKLTSDDLHRTHCLFHDTMQLTPKFLHIDDDDDDEDNDDDQEEEKEDEEEECSGDDETFKKSKWL